MCWMEFWFAGQITDMFSYYTLPSTVIGNPQYDSLKAAFAYYMVAESTSLKSLMSDALVVANNQWGSSLSLSKNLNNPTMVKNSMWNDGYMSSQSGQLTSCHCLSPITGFLCFSLCWEGASYTAFVRIEHRQYTASMTFDAESQRWFSHTDRFSGLLIAYDHLHVFKVCDAPGALPEHIGRGSPHRDSQGCLLSRQHDVFNALDILENSKVLKDLKFGIGDGRLRYYLYNWRLKEEMPPSNVGLVLLWATKIELLRHEIDTMFQVFAIFVLFTRTQPTNSKLNHVCFCLGRY